MKLLSIVLIIIMIVLLCSMFFLVRFLYRTFRSNISNKTPKLVISSFISLILVVVFVVTVIEVKTVDSGYHHSIGQYMISGIAGIEVKKRSFNIEEPVPVTFSYGHIKSNINEEVREIMIGHKIEVYLRDLQSTDEEDNILLYTREFDGVEFFSEDYYAGKPSLINIIIKNDYKENQILNVDFSTIDFDGRIVVRVTEIFYMKDNIDGEIISTETEDYSESYIYFKIEGDKVVFSTSR